MVTCYSPVRHSGLPESKLWALVRLACVKHAASVRPEPGSNSPLKKSLNSSKRTRPILPIYVRNLRWLTQSILRSNTVGRSAHRFGPAQITLETSVFNQLNALTQECSCAAEAADRELHCEQNAATAIQQPPAARTE